MEAMKAPGLQEAASKGSSSFLDFLISSIRVAAGNSLTGESLASLNWQQNTLLAYGIFKDEVMNGGFVQLIQNGYGGYIFRNPFAKSIRLFGVSRLATLVNKAGKIYSKNREDLEVERDEEEFMALYEKYEQFDDIEEEFIALEPDFTDAIAEYAKNNINEFITTEEHKP